MNIYQYIGKEEAAKIRKKVSSDSQKKEKINVKKENNNFKTNNK